MKRFFDVFNLLGIGALTLLCAGQWSTNTQLGRENDRLQTIRMQQAATIQSQADTIKRQSQDLDEFRDRLSTAESQLKQVALQLGKVTAQRDQFKSLSDSLASQLDQWKGAVKVRDELIVDVTKQRNDAIAQFNDLASKFNALVKQKTSGG